jgi:hypothetical protein
MADTTGGNFKAAVEATPHIENCYKAGLKALGSHSNKISLAKTSLCNGSVDIDKCLSAILPNDHRWDYCFGYNNEAYFVEIHPAATSDVGIMMAKLQWLKDWLNNHATELNKIKAAKSYYWIMTGKYDISPNSRQAKQIASVGLKPRANLILK